MGPRFPAGRRQLMGLMETAFLFLVYAYKTETSVPPLHSTGYRWVTVLDRLCVIVACVHFDCTLHFAFALIINTRSKYTEFGKNSSKLLKAMQSAPKSWWSIGTRPYAVRHNTRRYVRAGDCSCGRADVVAKAMPHFRRVRVRVCRDCRLTHAVCVRRCWHDAHVFTWFAHIFVISPCSCANHAPGPICSPWRCGSVGPHVALVECADSGTGLLRVRNGWDNGDGQGILDMQWTRVAQICIGAVVFPLMFYRARTMSTPQLLSDVCRTRLSDRSLIGGRSLERVCSTAFRFCPPSALHTHPSARASWRWWKWSRWCRGWSINLSCTICGCS